MEWYEIPADKRSAEQAEQAHRAHLNTLLLSLEGRQMWADMQRRVEEWNALIAEKVEYALPVCVLRDFMKTTRELCGPSDVMAIIKADRRTAATKERQKPKSISPDGVDEEEFNS